MKCFICYAHQDAELMAALESILLAGQHEVWHEADWMIEANSWQRILKQIEVCDIFLLATTPNSLQSPYCQSMYRYAIALNKPFMNVMLRESTITDPLLASKQVIAATEINNLIAVQKINLIINFLREDMAAQKYLPPSPRPRRPDLPMTTTASPMMPPSVSTRPKKGGGKKIGLLIGMGVLGSAIVGVIILVMLITSLSNDNRNSSSSSSNPSGSSGSSVNASVTRIDHNVTWNFTNTMQVTVQFRLVGYQFQSVVVGLFLYWSDGTPISCEFALVNCSANLGLAITGILTPNTANATLTQPFYVAYNVIPNRGLAVDNGYVVAAVSLDGGLTWTGHSNRFEFTIQFF